MTKIKTIFDNNAIASKHEIKMITALIENAGYNPDKYVSYFLRHGAAMQLRSIRK